MHDEDVTVTVTRLLEQAREGDRAAFDRLLELVYDQLREIAHGHRRGWKGNETIGTTVLVHEAYLKLVDHDEPSWKSRLHFLAVASRAMRQILIDYARARKAGKRGGGLEHVSLERVEELVPKLSDAGAESLVGLDDAMKRLERADPECCRIVECRFFGGMTIEETAEALGISPATVKRRWVYAKAWLQRAMTEPGTAT